MADRRRDEERRAWGERRDPETEQRIDRRADRYRGSDERGYGGGERLGRDWERGDPREEERFDADERIRSVDDERLGRGWERHGFRDIPRERDFGDINRGGRRESPSGAFHEELRAERERPGRYGGHDYHRPGGDVGRYDFGARGFGEEREHERRDHSHLAGLHDMDDMSELRERYREWRQQRDNPPRFGHGPGVQNMEPPLLGYSTSTTREEDHEMGHGGFLGGGTYRSGSPRPTGRGPKGYRRSDDRIREDICDQLMTGWMDAENVDVLVREGEVTLQGWVKSRAEKRAIETVAESVLGVKDVHNALKVNRGEQQPRAQDQEQTSAQPPGDTPLHS